MTEDARSQSGETEFQEFSAGGLRTFALTEGRTDGFPAIFLHGLPGASFIWQPVLPTLPRSIRSIAPDLPGWGKSRSKFADSDPQLNPDLFITWFEGLLRAQQVERFDLVAHGNSALLAGLVAQRFSKAVRRLGIVGLQASPRTRGTKFAIDLLSPRWNEQRVREFLRREMLTDDDARRTFTELLLQNGNPRRVNEAERTLGQFERFGDQAHAALAKFDGLKFVIGTQGDAVNSPFRSAHGWQEYFLETGAYPTLQQPEHVLPILKDNLAD